ncbi:MAG: BrnT family toxin [Candidatus Binatia bacterium]
MDGVISGFDWDDSNREKCSKHGVSLAEIEELFTQPVAIRSDVVHSSTEQRFCAVGKGKPGRPIFLVFTLRKRAGSTFIRPISARYMHKKEIEHYEKENPDL